MSCQLPCNSIIYSYKSICAYLRIFHSYDRLQSSARSISIYCTSSARYNSVNLVTLLCSVCIVRGQTDYICLIKMAALQLPVQGILWRMRLFIAVLAVTLAILIAVPRSSAFYQSSFTNIATPPWSGYSEPGSAYYDNNG